MYIYIYIYHKKTASQFQLHGLEGLEAALKSIQCIQSFEVSKPSSRCSFARRWQMFLWDPVDCTSVFRDRLSVTFRSSFFTKGVQRAVVNTLKRTDLFATLCNVNQFTSTEFEKLERLALWHWTPSLYYWIGTKGKQETAAGQLATHGSKGPKTCRKRCSTRPRCQIDFDSDQISVNWCLTVLHQRLVWDTCESM